jgi:hypothetical protein
MERGKIFSPWVLAKCAVTSVLHPGGSCKRMSTLPGKGKFAKLENA